MTRYDAVPETGSYKTVQHRLTVTLAAQAEEQVFDLWELNKRPPKTCNNFWDVFDRYLEEQALKSPDGRRHGEVVHLACAIYFNADFIAEVSKRLTQDVPVPFEAWVRFNLIKRSPFTSQLPSILATLR